MREPAELLDAYFDDSLCPAEIAQLRAWLSEDAAHLRRFVRQSAIHSRLRDVMLQQDMLGIVFDGAFTDTVDPQHIASLLDEEDARSERRAIEDAERSRLNSSTMNSSLVLDRKSLRIDQPRVPQAIVYASVIAAAALMVIAFQAITRTSTPELKSEVAASVPAEKAPTIATLTNAFDARLTLDDRAIKGGERLQAGVVFLQRGVAQLSFDSNVTIVVEAPARIELLTVDRARLISGSVVVQVPQSALGFTLHSEAAAFVDLGTEFGVEVSDSGRARMHVLDGEVALVCGKGLNPSQTLQRGTATEVSIEGVASAIVFDETKFVRRVPASAYELAVLKSRPLAYWRMDNVERNVNLVSEGELAINSIVNSGVDAVDNRQLRAARSFPPRAARFNGEHGGIDVDGNDALGIVSNCTYEGWVLPAVGNGPQRIFSTFDRPRSGLALGIVDSNWYKLPNNDLRLHFTVYGKFDCVSATAITPGEWVHVAATVDDAGTPALYVNGAAVEQRFRPMNLVGGVASQDVDSPELAGDMPDVNTEWTTTRETPIGVVTGGRARIGRNPLGSDGEISPECWQGQISNVAVYDRVLDVNEIRRHSTATRDKLTDHNNNQAL